MFEILFFYSIIYNIWYWKLLFHDHDCLYIICETTSHFFVNYINKI